MTAPAVVFADRVLDFQVAHSLIDRTAWCRCCTFSKTVPRGVPMVWVSHRCPGMRGSIVFWESA